MVRKGYITKKHRTRTPTAAIGVPPMLYGEGRKTIDNVSNAMTNTSSKQ